MPRLALALVAAIALAAPVRAQGDAPAPAPAPDPAPSPAPEPAKTEAKPEPKKEPAKAKAAAKKEKEEPPKPPPEPPKAPPEMVEKATKLKAEVTALLVAEPGDAHALESAATGANDAVVNADPGLRALLKLARGRALTIQGRYDEAQSQLQDAKGLVDGVSPREQRRLTSEVRFRLAELDEVRSKPAPSCGALGLARVAALEGGVERERVERLAARYKSAVQAGDRFWGRRAAFRTAMLYDDLYRFAIGKPVSSAGALRGIVLPTPFAIGVVDSKSAVVDILGGAWPAEISRLYSEIIASIDAREPDDILLEQARKKAAAFARLEIPDGEKAENPWHKDEQPGLVRYNKRFERKNADGTWSAVEPKVAKGVIVENLQKPDTSIEHAYALAAAAEAGPAPSTEQILASIKSDDERVELAGLVAAEKAPDPALLDVLVEHASRAAKKGEKSEPFSTLQGALFGTRERSLLALRALALKSRETAQKILDDTKLSNRERAWVVAELGDGRLEYSLQYLAGNGDAATAATALYGLYLSAGKNSLGYLRTSDTGVVGCVSRAIATIDASSH